MKKAIILCLIVVGLNFITSTIFALEQNLLTQLLDMGALLVAVMSLLISLGWGFGVYSKEKIRACFPFLALLIGLSASFMVRGFFGRMTIKNYLNKNSQRFAEAVRLIEKSDLKMNDGHGAFELPDQYAGLANKTVFVATNNNGIFIEFWTGGGFPLHHSGYLYVSSGNIQDNVEMVERWPSHWLICSNWYHISD